MMKVLTDEESLMMCRTMFKKLRPNDVIVLFDGEEKRPGIVGEVWPEKEEFSFYPLDSESAKKVLSGEVPVPEIKKIPTNTSGKLIWNNVSR